MNRVATVADADRIAEKAHDGQVDKAGQPYIDHPRAVAELLRECGDNAIMAGLLHDVVEDSDTTLDDLRAAGFPEEVVRAVDSVTRRNGETYMTMIGRAAADPLGCLVKLADNIHNTSRLDNLEEPVRSGLARRYERALAVLTAAADVHATNRARERLAEMGEHR